MTEPKETSTADASNPFASPGAPEVVKHDFPNVPNWRVVAIGMLLVGLGQLVPGVSLVSRSVAEGTGWVVPYLLIWATHGLGLALLIHAVWQRRFGTLAPGHWKLIAFLAMMIHVDAGWFLPWCVAACVMIVFILISLAESIVWRVYGGTCAATWLMELASVFQFRQLEALRDRVASPTRLAYMMEFSVDVYCGVIFFYFLTLAALCEAIRRDQQQHVPRDAYHWLGLGLVMLLPLIEQGYRIRMGEFP